MRLEPFEPGVIGEHGLSVEPVGVGALHGAHHLARTALALEQHPRIDSLCGRGPGHERAARRIVTESEMNLLRCAVAGGDSVRPGDDRAGEYRRETRALEEIAA